MIEEMLLERGISVSYETIRVVLQSYCFPVVHGNVSITKELVKGGWRDRFQGRALSEVRNPARGVLLHPLCRFVP